MAIEFKEIDDERLHFTTISPDGNTLTIYKVDPDQPINGDKGSITGYIAVTGIGWGRKLENEDCIEFGVMLEKALQNSELKIEIV